ncbi:MAG: HdeD family acid-resistance protein [Steroidobacteraceae bacterium]
MLASNPIGASIAAGLNKIHDSWGWFIALGIALILLGSVCILGNVTATLATVLAFGWLLIMGAVVALIQAFQVRSWSGFFLLFLTALLRGFTGYMLVRYPLAGEYGLTMLLASLFIVGGVFRAFGAGALKFPQWGWAVFSGIVSLGLGIMLLTQLPISSLWFIGMAIGIDFIFDGGSFIALGVALRDVPGGRSLARA